MIVNVSLAIYLKCFFRFRHFEPHVSLTCVSLKKPRVRQLLIKFLTIASGSSLSTVQFMYLYSTATAMPWISCKIYFELNAEILKGNAAVLSILPSLKRLITSERTFYRSITQQLC